jgi:hypothetical protein
MATVAMQRLDGTLRVREGHQWMERADLRPCRHRRSQDLGPEGAARMDHRLTAVHPKRAGEGGDRVVGDREDDELDLVEDRLRVGEDADDVDERAEPLTAGRVAAGDGVDRPAGTRQRHPQSGPDRPRPDDPDDRWLAGFGMRVRMDVVARVGLVAMAVHAGRRRVEIDAGRLDGGFLLGAISLGVVAGQTAPRLHRYRLRVGVSCRRSCTRGV